MSPVPPPPLPKPVSAVIGTPGAALEVRPLGFNCPSCGVVLTIPNPSSYDGRPAPCPQCAVLVVPPRIFQPGQEAESIDLHPLPGLSACAGTRIKTPRAVHRPLRHCVARGDAGGLGVGDRPEGVVLSGSA